MGLYDIVVPEFGTRLKKVLKEKHITQSKMAKMLGTNTDTVNKWCNDWCMPNAGVVKRICEILKISADYLLELSDDRNYEGQYWKNISDIEARQTAKGVKEYGQTLEQNQEPSVEERISYIEEELVDALKYLEWLKDGMNEN